MNGIGADAGLVSLAVMSLSILALIIWWCIFFRRLRKEVKPERQWLVDLIGPLAVLVPGTTRGDESKRAGMYFLVFVMLATAVVWMAS